MAELIKILIAYLLGSVSGSLVIGKLRQVDIRTMGSGNAGGTNALRTQGIGFALTVVVIDIGKGVLAAGVIPFLEIPWLDTPPVTEPLILACAMAAILGHCYPAWHGFRGGKGAATSLGALAVINPWFLVPMVATWLVSLVITGYVGLSTVLAGWSLVVVAFWLDASSDMKAFVFLLALLMTFTHRKNLRAMIKGTENRFEKARLATWFGRRDR